MLRLDESHHPRVAKASEAVASFIAAFCRQDRSSGTWLVLAGDLGTGKTTLARAAVRYVRNRAADILYATEWRDKSRSPRAEFEKWADLVAIEKEVDFRDQLYDIDEAHLVALDDIGREADKFKAGVPQVRLAEVLDRCKKKWLIVTTNFLLRDWSGAFDNRIVSRLSMANYVSLEGVPDYRPNLRV